MRSKVYVTVGCLSVHLSHRSTAEMAARGLLLSAVQAGDRSIAAGAVLQARRRSAENAGSVTLRADEEG